MDEIKKSSTKDLSNLEVSPLLSQLKKEENVKYELNKNDVAELESNDTINSIGKDKVANDIFINELDFSLRDRLVDNFNEHIATLYEKTVDDNLKNKLLKEDNELMKLIVELPMKQYESHLLSNQLANRQNNLDQPIIRLDWNQKERIVNNLTKNHQFLLNHQLISKESKTELVLENEEIIELIFKLAIKRSDEMLQKNVDKLINIDSKTIKKVDGQICELNNIQSTLKSNCQLDKLDALSSKINLKINQQVCHEIEHRFSYEINKQMKYNLTNFLTNESTNQIDKNLFIKEQINLKSIERTEKQSNQAVCDLFTSSFESCNEIDQRESDSLIDYSKLDGMNFNSSKSDDLNKSKSNYDSSVSSVAVTLLGIDNMLNFFKKESRLVSKSFKCSNLDWSVIAFTKLANQKYLELYLFCEGGQTFSLCNLNAMFTIINQRTGEAHRDFFFNHTFLKNGLFGGPIITLDDLVNDGFIKNNILLVKVTLNTTKIIYESSTDFI